MSAPSPGERKTENPLKNFGKKLLFGVAKVFVALANLFARPAGGSASLRQSKLMEEEIRSLVDSAGETGEMESDETELIHSVLEFSDTVAREIMFCPPSIRSTTGSCDTTSRQSARIVSPDRPRPLGEFDEAARFCAAVDRSCRHRSG